MYRVYISASTQGHNVGVGQYGTEQDRMMQLSDRVKYWLETQKTFTVFRNQPGWSLSMTVNDCNKLACEIFVDNHTNAGPGSAAGTEVFYCHQAGTASNSYKLADLLYKEVAPISPGGDRGVLPDNNYVSSLFVIQNTNPPAALIEHIFHTNYEEVEDIINNMDKYAKAEAKAICKYFGVRWEEPEIESQSIETLVRKMIEKGIITDLEYWYDVLSGKTIPEPRYLQIAFARATSQK